MSIVSFASGDTDTLKFVVILKLLLKYLKIVENSLNFLFFKKCLSLIVREMSTETEFSHFEW